MFNAPEGEDMETVNHPSAATHLTAHVREGVTGSTVVPLHLETRAAVDTATAAHHLSRQSQTLRGWACFEDGPLRPLRINGRLAWKTDDLRRLLGVA
jgi:hypothetical protein